MAYEAIRVETRNRVAIVRLNRPRALNAINAELVAELNGALDGFAVDPNISVVVLTGSPKAFAAGADIKEMAERTFPANYVIDENAGWDRLSAFRKPIIAAVEGVALGGGCELAMLCDMIIAAETARFGQPEIRLGIIPGVGGTQRLPRAIGKAKAMDLCLTGRMMSAEEAERSGLVARVLPADGFLDAVLEIADEIAGRSLPALMAVKEAINAAFESPLAEGRRFERRIFQALFATEDQKEGMSAFLEKRKPDFRHR